jgi:hypothetical protein
MGSPRIGGIPPLPKAAFVEKPIGADTPISTSKNVDLETFQTVVQKLGPVTEADRKKLAEAKAKKTSPAKSANPLLMEFMEYSPSPVATPPERSSAEISAFMSK